MKKNLREKFISLLCLVLLMSILQPLAFNSQVLAEGKVASSEAALINPLTDEGFDPESEVNYRANREKYDPEFFEAGLAYFEELAGYKNNDLPYNHYIKKWLSPIRLGYNKKLSDEQVKVLEQLLEKMAKREFLPEYTMTGDIKEGRNVNLYLDKFRKINLRYFNGSLKENYGFNVNWTGEPPYRLYMGLIGIASDKLEEAEINLQLQEKAVQILGFIASSATYEDSIFNPQAQDLKGPSALDWLVMEMLYAPELKVGMDFDRAVEILENLYLGEADYDPSKEEASQAELDMQAELEVEAEAAEACRKKWEAYGVQINPEGERQSFLERKDEIDPEFFELGLEYYEEVAGYGEFDSSDDGFVKKWEDPIYITTQWLSEENPEITACLERVVKQLNSVAGMPEITISDNESEERTPDNIFIYLGEMHELAALIPNIQPGNWGFFNYWWADDPQYKINMSKIIVATDLTTLDTARHLLQEELIQSLGLINDSFKYKDSIFQQDWGHIQYPGELDWLLLEFHYHPEIKPGMPMDEALAILRNTYLGESAE